MNWYKATAWLLPAKNRIRRYTAVQASDPTHAAKRLRKLLPGYEIRVLDVDPTPCVDTDDFGIREVFPLPTLITDSKPLSKLCSSFESALKDTNYIE
jgi:hypothetical protein